MERHSHSCLTHCLLFSNRSLSATSWVLALKTRSKGLMSFFKRLGSIYWMKQGAIKSSLNGRSGS